MVAMGKAARVRPQAGPSYQRTDLLRRTRTGAICPARRWTKKRDHFFVSSFDAVFSGVSCSAVLLSKRLLVVRARAEFRNRARASLAPMP